MASLCYPQLSLRLHGGVEPRYCVCHMASLCYIVMEFYGFSQLKELIGLNCSSSLMAEQC